MRHAFIRERPKATRGRKIDPGAHDSALLLANSTGTARALVQQRGGGMGPREPVIPCGTGAAGAAPPLPCPRAVPSSSGFRPVFLFSQRYKRGSVVPAGWMDRA